MKTILVLLLLSLSASCMSGELSEADKQWLLDHGHVPGEWYENPENMAWTREHDAQKDKGETWKPNYFLEGFLPMVWITCALIALVARSWGVAIVFGTVYVCQALWECSVYGDKILGAYVAYMGIHLSIGIAVFVVGLITKVFSWVVCDALTPVKQRSYHQRRSSVKTKKSYPRRR